MNVLLDTNIALDVILRREPWVNPLLGRAKRLGSKSTQMRFMQMKNEDRALEIEALKNEAAQKAVRRFTDPSGDALQRFCGSLAHIYTEDGVAIQRRMRDEWAR